MMHDDPFEPASGSLLDSEFDLNARAGLSMAFPSGDPPAGLYRHRPFWKKPTMPLMLLCGLLVSGIGGVLAVRPPELVRGAIEHEYYERTLRGQFMSTAELASKFDLPAHSPVPGFTQLIRPCDINGKVAYHLTTFFEKGGMVTLFAFDGKTDLPQGRGWWSNVYWEVKHDTNGKVVVMVAQKEKAISAATRAFEEARRS